MTVLITAGHATIDFLLELLSDTAKVVWSEKKKDDFICLDFDDKTPVQSIHWALGGNAVNSGIGLARLGVNTALISEVGDDLWGRLIEKELHREGLKLNHLKVDPEQTTDLSVILSFKGERTILSYHYPRVHQFPKRLPAAEWFYLTSLGERFANFHVNLLDWLKNKPVKLAYNPGVYELRAGLEANRDIIQRCEVLDVNREEAGTLLGTRPEEVDEQLLTDLHKLGAKLVVITDGQKGSFAYDGQQFYRQGIYPAERIEATGAGDAFTAGLLAALVHGRDIAEALKWGSVNSASVIQHYGAIKGLLKRKELEEKLSEWKV